MTFTMICVDVNQDAVQLGDSVETCVPCVVDLIKDERSGLFI